MKQILSIFFSIVSIHLCLGNVTNKTYITKEVVILGNCDMCKKNIETAGTIKKISTTIWNKNTQIATIQYDEDKISLDQILKKIALAGYDNEHYLSPNMAYQKLPICCQYARKYNTAFLQTNANIQQPTENKNNVAPENKTIFSEVIEAYFNLKYAFVTSEPTIVSQKAKELLQVTEAVQMDKLSHTEHIAWMSLHANLTIQTKQIVASTDISKQRTFFIELSKNVYTFLKDPSIHIYKDKTIIYWQNCPMANNGKGANWLSKENTIKNPYFGSMMISCGSTLETISQ